jgi:glycosyltransferase involved in cell wall biosynthesis
MKIYIDNGRDHVVVRRMIPYWIQNDCKVVNEISGADIHLSFVLFHRNSSLPKIHRVDGIYYNTQTNYKSWNAPIIRAHSMADGIIYQSEFSQIMVPLYMEDRKPNSKTKVIYNGIDEGWVGPHEEENTFNIVVSAIWRRHKRLKEIIELFLEFIKSHNAFLHILGKLEANAVYQHPKICYHGYISYDKMVTVFKKANLSIHLSKKDSCPNTVVEAIGAGVPVITTNACGGATDMAEATKGCVVCFGDGNYDDISPAPYYADDYNKLSDESQRKILEAMDTIYKDRRRVKMPEFLTARYMANEYLNFMKEIV